MGQIVSVVPEDVQEKYVFEMIKHCSADDTTLNNHPIYVTASSKDGYLVDGDRGNALKMDIIHPHTSGTACEVARRHLVKTYLSQKTPAYLETWKFTHKLGVVFYFGNCCFMDTVHTSHTPMGKGQLQKSFLNVATDIPPCLEMVIEELVRSGIYDDIMRPIADYKKQIWDYSYPVQHQCPKLRRQPFDSTNTFHLDIDVIFEPVASLIVNTIVQLNPEDSQRYALQVLLPGHAGVILGEGKRSYLVEPRNLQRKFKHEKIVQMINSKFKPNTYVIDRIPEGLVGVQNIESMAQLFEDDPQGYCQTWALIIANSFKFTKLPIVDIIRCLSKVTPQHLRELVRKVNLSIITKAEATGYPINDTQDRIFQWQDGLVIESDLDGV